jgi:hypothetical protein
MILKIKEINMKKSKYILFILTSLINLSTSIGQSNEFEKVILLEGECEFEYLKELNYLSSSVESIVLLKDKKKVKYYDENNTKHKFSCSHENLPIWCEYKWICDTDTSLNKTYFVPRPTIRKTLSSKSNHFKIEYHLSTVVNKINPKTCSDILYVSVKANGDESFSKLIIAQRSDLTNTNNELKFHKELKIDNNLYRNVYEDNVKGYQYFYNLEFGIIMLKDLNGKQILTIKI